MLLPAVLYKDQIEHQSDLLRYSDKMMFYNGCTETGRIQIQTEPTEGKYQWAIVDQDNNLVGYVSYMIDYFSSNIYGFGLIAFCDNKQVITSGVLQVIEKIEAMNIHRIEWRCVGDNPAYLRYVRICENLTNYTHNIFKLTDIFKDATGKYHDCYIFELIRRET